MDTWIHTLVQGDQWLFECINGGLGNPFFDALLPFFREKWFWAPLYLFLAAYSLVNFGRRGWLPILAMVVVIVLADSASSILIKKNVQRIRPCNDPAMVERLEARVSCGGGYSFTSSHAANHFAAAIFLIGAFGLGGRWQQKALLFWAGLIAFSQVYVGVHYPLDVVCGGLLGCLIGWLVLFGWRKLPIRASEFSRQYP